MVKGTYRLLPGTDSTGPFKAAPARWDALVDGAVRFFAFGDADKLVSGDVRLVFADPAPGVWAGTGTVRLRWTDLGSDKIRYEVRLGPNGGSFNDATHVATTAEPQASVAVPTDGGHTVWVRPVADRSGRATAFGPFRIDASPPPTPLLTAPAEPPGYRFDVTWTETADLSGIRTYELQRRLAGTNWESLTSSTSTLHREDQVGSGGYEYRVRALNGAGVASEWSAPVSVTVRAPMQNPGAGVLTYGIHANYTGFLHLWDLSDPGKYVSTTGVPSAIRATYLGAEPKIEVNNETLRFLVQTIIGGETNTLRIAEKLFIYLFDHADYDTFNATNPGHSFQRAGLTLDRGLGICGDLAVLYTTLLRIAGVPARPVHGYLDNALSGIGGFHMWVEVYVGPADSPKPWMTVDVSGVTGTFEPADLFPYFGVFNPDYLALGNELDYDRYDDDQWNTWARFRYSYTGARPEVADQSIVRDYESEYGRLFFDEVTKRTKYSPCANPNAARPEDPCPNEPAPAGFRQFYGAKGSSKKVIDYGARLVSALPSCLKVEVRYPVVDGYGAVVPDQSAIYRVYENSASPAVQVGAPDVAGWVTFVDGTNVPAACANL